MKNARIINEDLYYVGASDRKLELFENMFPLSRGVSYNSYVLLDEKNVIFDTVDSAVEKIYLENIKSVLNGKTADYLIINHMEPDHASAIDSVVALYPEITIVGNSKTLQILKQFNDKEYNFLTIADGETLSTGKHELLFIMMPMVHWPETMMTYDKTDGTLFSADAFGTFGAIDGNILEDEIDFDALWQEDARRYYSNIVGKYGAQVQVALKKAEALDIKMICSLHGPIWKKNISWIVEKYSLWSKWQSENDDVLIAYSSMYGNTENAVNIVARILCEKGKKVKLMNICNTDKSYVIAEIFRTKNIILASPTYNGGIYPAMEILINDMKSLMVKDRRIALIENGTWAPVSGRQMRAVLETMKNIEITGVLTIKSALKENQSEQIEEFCNGLIE